MNVENERYGGGEYSQLNKRDLQENADCFGLPAMNIQTILMAAAHETICHFYMRFRARRASAMDFSMRADSSRTPPTLMRKKVLPFKT